MYVGVENRVGISIMLKFMGKSYAPRVSGSIKSVTQPYICNV